MRVCLATAGHLSTCPRMVKAADALDDAGYDVHVVSTRATDWAARADQTLIASRRWSWEAVDVSRASGGWRRRWTGARHRAARALAARLPGSALPASVADAAFSRASRELHRAIARARPDAVYAGTSGAIGPACVAARSLGRPYGIDLEDLHTAERDDAGAEIHHHLADRVLRRALPGAALVTTSSDLLAAAYRDRYGVDPLVVHNVWPLPARAPSMAPRPQPLGFYWFSQTIGPRRGLEEAIRAIGAAGIDARLAVRGLVDAAYGASLARLAKEVAPRLALGLLPPVPPDDIPSSCAGYDAGLSTELDDVENRRLALSNKLFMYLTTGLAVVATTTPSQRAALGGIESHVAWLDSNRPERAATPIQCWDRHRDRLAAARHASWNAAVSRWRWDHPLERDRFVERFAQAFG